MQIEDAEVKSHIILVTNIDSKSTKQNIYILFQKYGKVNFVDIVKRKNQHIYAIIEYDDMRDAYDALQGLNGQDFQGKKLRIQFKNESAKIINEQLVNNEAITSGPRIQLLSTNHNGTTQTSEQNSNSIDNEWDSSSSEKQKQIKQFKPFIQCSQALNQDTHCSQQFDQCKQQSKKLSKQYFQKSVSKESSKSSFDKSKRLNQSEKRSMNREPKRSSNEISKNSTQKKLDKINEKARSRSRYSSRSSSPVNNDSTQIKRLEKDIQNLTKKMEAMVNRIDILQTLLLNKKSEESTLL